MRIRRRIFVALLIATLGSQSGGYFYCVWYNGLFSDCGSRWNLSNSIAAWAVIILGMNFPAEAALYLCATAFLVVFVWKRWPWWTCLFPFAAFAAGSFGTILKFRTG
jgi:hypothetical protein